MILILEISQFTALSCQVGSFGAGFGNFVYGEKSASIGFQNQSIGLYSLATGALNVASGESSYAGGNQNTASGKNSFAIGFQTSASAPMSVAVGRNTVALGENSFAGGFKSTASTSCSFVYGEGLTTGLNYGAAFGKYNEGNNKQLLFEIGNGTSDTKRKTVFMIAANGNAGIYNWANKKLYSLYHVLASVDAFNKAETKYGDLAIIAAYDF